MMLPKVLAFITPTLWFSSLGALVGQAVFAQVPTDVIGSAAGVAQHLQDKNLTYAAIFLSCVATGATVYVVRMLIAAQEKNRETHIRSIEAMEKLTESIARQPCAMIDRGDAYVVMRQNPPTQKHHTPQ